MTWQAGMMQAKADSESESSSSETWSTINNLINRSKKPNDYSNVFKEKQTTVM